MTAFGGSVAFFGVQTALLVWSLVASWRLNRRLRHAAALDQLLSLVVIEAFTLRHQPIWQAWTAVMGDISVEVSQRRHLP